MRMMMGGAAAGAEVVDVAGGGRGLYEGEQERPGRSELAYMQHKYTRLDWRIIIITAAILLLLLSILFLNFFIRWALRRFFLFHSSGQKPLNPNKGLSKRQLQALPSFTYSSSKPPIFYFTPPPSPSHTFDFVNLKSFSSNSFHHTVTPIAPTKVDDFYHNNIPPTKSTIIDHNSPSQLVSPKVDEVDNTPPTKFASLEVDEVNIEGKNHPTRGDEVANDAISIIGSTIANVLTIDSSEDKANSPTFKGGNPIIDCPICLVDYADGDTIRVLPNCGHYFHIACIDTWLTKSSSCPACRTNILEAPIKHPSLQVQVIITTSH